LLYTMPNTGVEGNASPQPGKLPGSGMDSVEQQAMPTMQRFYSVSSTSEQAQVHANGSEHGNHSVSSLQSYETQEPLSPASATFASTDDDAVVFMPSYSPVSSATFQTIHGGDASDAAVVASEVAAPFKLEAIELSEAEEVGCDVDLQVQAFIDLVKRPRSNEDLSKFMGEAEAFHEILDAEMSALAAQSTTRIDELQSLIDALHSSTQDTKSLIGTPEGVGGKPTGSYRKIEDKTNDVNSLKERHVKKILDQKDMIEKTENSIAQKLQDLERKTGRAAQGTAKSTGALPRLYKMLDSSLFVVNNDMNKLKDIQAAVESLHKGVYTVVKDDMCIPTMFSFLEATLLISMHFYSCGKHVLWLSRSLREKGLGGNVFFGLVVFGVLYLLKVALVVVLDWIQKLVW